MLQHELGLGRWWLEKNVLKPARTSIPKMAILSQSTANPNEGTPITPNSPILYYHCSKMTAFLKNHICSFVWVSFMREYCGSTRNQRVRCGSTEYLERLRRVTPQVRVIIAQSPLSIA